MASRSESCVSAVLRDYLPEKKQGQENDRKSKKSSDGRSYGKSRSARSGLRRERTEDILRRQQIERQEQQYKNWEYVKDEARDEKHDLLTRKVALQKELIQAQDLLYEQQREHEGQELTQKREAARFARQTKQEALMKICRESLEEDRKNRIELRAENKKNKGSAVITTGKDNLPQDGDSYSRHARQVAPPDGYGLRLRRISSLRQMDASGSVQEQTEQEESGDDKLDDVENLPWHQIQLYQMYGRKHAEHFLHPKLEPKVHRPLNPKLCRQGGRAGAGALWWTLRDESRRKLLREDASIPAELKFAYSAFVRQQLAKKKKPVKRNYFSKEDVPEMTRLLDQSLFIAVQDLRHKHELMYRSSRTNQDRTHVLVYNNPLPNFNNWTGEESIERYLPSWLDDQSKMSHQSYKKWLSSWQQASLPASTVNEEEPDNKEQTAVSKEDMEIWQFLTEQPFKTEKSPKPKVLFLTEAEARCAGQFSQKYKEQREAKHLPKGHEREAKKAESALETVDRGSQSDRASITSGMSCESAPIRTQSRTVQSQDYVSEWQPLSINALVEYKKKFDTSGEGEFRQGQHRMFTLMEN